LGEKCPAPPRVPVVERQAGEGIRRGIEQGHAAIGTHGKGALYMFIEIILAKISSIVSP
jgi:hypothetical protein